MLPRRSVTGAEACRAQSKAKAEAQREQQEQQRAKREQEAQVAAAARTERRLRTAYMAAAPGATEAEFSASCATQLRERRQTAAQRQQQGMRSGIRRRLARFL